MSFQASTTKLTLNDWKVFDEVCSRGELKAYVKCFTLNLIKILFWNFTFQQQRKKLREFVLQNELRGQ